METNLSVGEDNKYIILTGKGEMKVEDPNLLIQPLVEAFELAAYLKIRRLLVDLTGVRNTLGIADRYTIIKHTIAQKPAIDRGVRVALLVAPDDHSHDFSETVAKNTGFNLTLYRDRTQAIESLKDDSCGRQPTVYL